MSLSSGAPLRLLVAATFGASVVAACSANDEPKASRPRPERRNEALAVSSELAFSPSSPVGIMAPTSITWSGSNFVLGWWDTRGVFVSRTNDRGATRNPVGDFVANEPNPTAPVQVAATRSRTLVAWGNADGAIRVALLDSDDHVLVAARTLATTSTGFPTVVRVGKSDYGFAVAWDDGDSVRTLRLREDGTSIGAAPTTLLAGRLSDLACRPVGQCVAVAARPGSASGRTAIFARVFDESGPLTASDTEIAAPVAADATEPSVAFASSGIYVAWDEAASVSAPRRLVLRVFGTDLVPQAPLAVTSASLRTTHSTSRLSAIGADVYLAARAFNRNDATVLVGSRVDSLGNAIDLRSGSLSPITAGPNTAVTGLAINDTSGIAAWVGRTGISEVPGVVAFDVTNTAAPSTTFVASPSAEESTPVVACAGGVSQLTWTRNLAVSVASGQVDAAGRPSTTDALPNPSPFQGVLALLPAPSGWSFAARDSVFEPEGLGIGRIGANGKIIGTAFGVLDGPAGPANASAPDLLRSGSTIWVAYATADGAIQVTPYDTVTSFPGARTTLSTALLNSDARLASDGTNLVAVWTQSIRGARSVVARRFGTDGVALDAAPVRLATTSTEASTIAVTWDGHSYVATSHLTTGRLVFVRFGSDGTVLDPSPVTLSVTSEPLVPSSIVATGSPGRSVATWSEAGVVRFAWIDDGVVLDPGGVVLADGSVNSRSVCALGSGRVLVGYSRTIRETPFGSNQVRAKIVGGGAVDGAACDADARCESRHCVDGVCCESACDGACRTCSATPGSCTALRSQDDAPSCAGSSSCDATGACKNVLATACTSDAACISGFCSGGTCCESRCGQPCETCVATPGTCTLKARGVTAAACHENTCSGTTAECPRDCAADVDCTSSAY
ncbi:MAG: hypothetical protein U0169_04765 [Polyangiaceae bacterium]